MILADCHTHTTFSFDARDNEHSDPENMIRTAIAKGLKYYSITDHEDGPRDDIDYHFDSDEYFKVLTALKNKYSNQIEVGVGIEIGLDPKYTDYSNRIVASKPFDIVVGSVHYVYGIDPYYPEYFRDRTFDEGYRRALNTHWNALIPVRTLIYWDTLIMLQDMVTVTTGMDFTPVLGTFLMKY